MDEGNVIIVQATGTKEHPSFSLSGALNNSQIQKVSEILHFNDSLDEISAHFAHTDLAPIFAEHEGTPLIRSFSLYGTLMRSIIHQQLNMSFANTLSMRFVENIWK